MTDFDLFEDLSSLSSEEAYDRLTTPMEGKYIVSVGKPDYDYLDYRREFGLYELMNYGITEAHFRMSNFRSNYAAVIFDYNGYLVEVQRRQWTTALYMKDNVSGQKMRFDELSTWDWRKSVCTASSKKAAEEIIATLRLTS